MNIKIMNKIDKTNNGDTRQTTDEYMNTVMYM